MRNPLKRKIRATPSRVDVAQMNVAICEALGIDPKGIVAMTVQVQKDEVPRITVTYSVRYIREAMDAMSDGTWLGQVWEYQLVPVGEPELAAPANGSDWVDDTTVGEEHGAYAQPPTPTELGDTPRPEGAWGARRYPGTE